MNFDTDGNNIFQILFSDNPEQDLQALPAISDNCKSFKILHPELRYNILSNDSIRSFIASYFEDSVLATFDALVPYAYKADLARYCLLYIFGGIYADLSMRLLARLVIPPGKMILCFRDAYVNGSSTWSVSNGLLRANPQRPEFRTAIDLIISNYSNLYYGPSPLHPTGPALFGRALALTNRGEDLEIGDFRNLTGTMHPLSYGYIDPVGRLVCIRMKEEGNDLSLMGVKGLNRYDTLWDQNIVYGESIIINQTDKKFHLFQGDRHPEGVEITPMMSGWIVFGPYIDLASGRYQGYYQFEPGFISGGLTVDVIANDIGDVARRNINILDENSRASIDFQLFYHCQNLEFRLSAHGNSKGRCIGLTIKRLSNCEEPVSR